MGQFSVCLAEKCFHYELGGWRCFIKDQNLFIKELRANKDERRKANKKCKKYVRQMFGKHPQVTGKT